ncbi:MAG: tRNA (guanosine(46)-N7)-methyltransferase TrmB [Parvularculaceae bacterium]
MSENAYIPCVYGRRQGKPLRQRQAQLMDELLPRVAVPVSDRVDPKTLFPRGKEAWLEVGFGGGEHLAWHAGRNPDVLMIGAEPFLNGVARLLVDVDEQKLDNVRVHFGDARPLIEALPDASLSRVFVLHPDPWPKKRHYKRRMISPWFFAEAARLLRPGGELRVASDIRDYIRWTLMHAQHAADFEWTAARAADWKTRPGDWPQTRYEAKSLREGRTPAYLTFRRK